jgi:hypothetical protein
MNRVLNRRKIQHLIEIHLETCWVQRSLTDFSVAKSLLSSLSNELQQKSKRIDEMIENRKENIGVIDKKTGSILANIDDVKDVVIKHLNDFLCERVAHKVQQGLE